jgi:hypothetical protein
LPPQHLQAQIELFHHARELGIVTGFGQNVRIGRANRRRSRFSRELLNYFQRGFVSHARNQRSQNLNPPILHFSFQLLKLFRCPRSRAPTLVKGQSGSDPSMSLIPFAPFSVFRFNSSTPQLLNFSTSQLLNFSTAQLPDPSTQANQNARSPVRRNSTRAREIILNASSIQV